MMPKFSVIIPVHNIAPYLKECLDSVLNQSFPDWECVVVNDGSTDESGTILDAYAAKDRRFRVFHQKNRGVGAARNFALEQVKGEWILFLDGDDVWAPQMLETVSRGIADYPEGELFRFNWVNFPENSSCEFPEGRDALFLPLDISREIPQRDFIDYLFWCYAFKSSLIAGMTFPRYIRGEDRVFLGEVMLSRVNRLFATDAALYGYRQRTGSAVHSRASVQVLKDELSHRVDVIRMIDASGKRMPYRRNWWLEGYCLKGYLDLAEGKGSTYSKAERAELIRWFYRERRRFAKAKDFSLPGKVLARLYAVPGYPWRRLLRFALSCYAFGMRACAGVAGRGRSSDRFDTGRSGWCGGSCVGASRGCKNR